VFRLFRRERVTRQSQAIASLDDAAERFRQAAEKLTGADADLFWDMAEAVERLRRHIADNAEHLNPLRRLWVFFVPRAAEKALAWARLARRDPLSPPDRTALAFFRDFLQLLKEADQACRVRMYERLDTALQALEQQLEQVRM